MRFNAQFYYILNSNFIIKNCHFIHFSKDDDSFKFVTVLHWNDTCKVLHKNRKMLMQGLCLSDLNRNQSRTKILVPGHSIK